MNWDFDVLLQPETWIFAGIIFGLRVVNMATDTLRVMMVLRGRKAIAWLFGFTQSVIFVVVLTSVIDDLNNVLSVIAYAAGFATGNILGMWIEERLAIGFVHMRVISVAHGQGIAKMLRKEGYAVTELTGRGKDGRVTMLEMGIRRKDVVPVRKLVNKIDEDAFITAEDLRSVRRGFWHR